MPPRICLAVTCHDPRGSFAQGVRESAPVLRAVFADVAVNATHDTHASTREALAAAFPDRLVVAEHVAGSIGIGTARRDALRLALALRTPATHVFYSDLDHVLRWALTDPGELRASLDPVPGADLTVIGRTPRAFAAEPERLRATEGVVNRIAAMALGHRDEPWDLMIAIRLMTAATAQLVVDECVEESIANDVVWPAHVASRGRSLGYRAADGLAYRFRDDFGTPADNRDRDPLEWVERVEIATLHATALRPFLPQAQP